MQCGAVWCSVRMCCRCSGLDVLCGRDVFLYACCSVCQCIAGCCRVMSNACIYAHMYTCMYECVWTHACTRVCVYECVCMHVRVFACMQVYAYM